MKNVKHRPSLVHAPTLALACFGAACSGEYPLGNLSNHEQRLDLDPGSVALADAALSPVLGAPDVTIDAHDLKLTSPGSLVAAGDLDGDGFEDMAVSAWDFDTNTEYVHLRYGGPRPATPADSLAFELGAGYLIVPERMSLSSLSAAGDVDGDGYGDLLVRSFECDSTKPDEGVYLVYGGPERRDGVELLTDVAVHFVPPLVEAPPGTGCVGVPSSGDAGDLDGDGIDDLVLSSHVVSARTGSQGVYLFYGRSQRFTGAIPFGAADAKFEAAHKLDAVPTGDVDGDALDDLLIGSRSVRLGVASRFALVPGRAERWSGIVDLEANAVGFDGLWADGVSSLAGGALGDLDADGLNDVVLIRDGDYASFLFYGAPGLFAGGADPAAADAELPGDSSLGLFPAGDLDADGDDELVAQFNPDGSSFPDFAILGGSSERFADTFSVPEADALEHGQRFRNAKRAIDYTYAAGDLDGDGAGDLFSLSSVLNDKPDGHFERVLPQIHIHYGSAPASNPLR